MYSFKVGDVVRLKVEYENYWEIHLKQLGHLKDSLVITEIVGDLVYFKGTPIHAGTFFWRFKLLSKGQLRLPFKENKNGTVKF